MQTRSFAKFLAMSLAVMMLIGMLPINALAAIDYNTAASTDDYYKVISKKDWELAPGIEETEIVLNNDQGSLRQVVHSVKVDMNNPYTKVIPGYKGMIPTPGNYGVEATSTQAKNAEALGYGNVVAATNAMLSWYNSAYYKANPHLIGEPLGYGILNGYYYENSQGQSFGTNTALVINYDYHPITGEKRPDDMPKVLMREVSDPITGWEENAIAVWAYLVKPDANGVPQNQYADPKKYASQINHTSGFESRTFVGVTANGEIIISVSDGRQSPYSAGFNMYEMADYMIKMGCVYAANCDGGGSTTFVSERPGEDLKVNCSLSDGGERPTTNTLLVISTASASGTFERATLSTDYDYYTPGSSVTFDVLGTDAVGTKVDVPTDVEWAIKEEGMGTIANGVFTSNGTPGQVTAQVLYNGKVVGERTITLALPDKLSFSQPVLTIPYGKRAQIPVKATLNGLFEIGLSPADVTITSSNPDLGTIDGLHFIGAAKAPENNSSTVTVTLNSDPTITASTTMKLGEASVVMWDFEDGQEDIDEWNAVVIRNPGEDHRDFKHDLSLATKEDGQVHDGNYSMRLETNGLSSAQVHSQQYAYVRLGLRDQKISLENARSLGFWLYVPEDNIQCWVQGYYKYDSNGDGVVDTLAEVNLMNSENVYYNVDESGWHYLSMDLSDFEKIDLTYSAPFDEDPSDGKTGATDEIFLTLIFHKSINNILWQTNGSINGPFTYYIDNVTVDYSEVVEDREEPIFESVIIDNDGMKTGMTKHGLVTTKNNKLNVVANVVEATYRTDGTGTKHSLSNYTGLNAASAKAYVDGVEVKSTYENGKIAISDLAVADGYHRVKFEIYDNAGNKSTVVRMVKVESGVKASTIKVVPANPALVEKDRLDFGSLFWMNMVATNIETIQSVKTVVDLNSVNHWQLDHMVVADGFSADYIIDQETNTATINFTRTGTNYYSGEAVLAQLPIRMIYFDTDMKIPGYTAETVWTKYNFWPHDLKVDVDLGEITYVKGYTSDVLNTFSNEKFRVNTEMYTDYQMMGSDSYFVEHGSTHVHTPVALADKAAGCTDGYTDRTYCEVCESIVDWGTTVPATTSHKYELVDGVMTCVHCGDIFNGTFMDGFTYYNGVAAVNGWVEIDGVQTYYYKDGVKFVGSNLIDGKMYTFDENGVYLPNYIYDGFFKHNGKTMFFVNNEYLTGAQPLGNDFYYFDDNGFGIEGEFVICGETCLFAGGRFASANNIVDAGWCGDNVEYVVYSDGLLKLAGSGMTYAYKNHGNRPFIDCLEMITKIEIGKDITLLRHNIFSFLLAKEVVFEEGSVLENISTGAFHSMPYLQSINIPESVTTIGAIAFKNCTGLKKVNASENIVSIYSTAFKGCSSSLVFYVEEGSYAETFATENGFKCTYEDYIRNGFVEEDGELYYYENDVKWTRRGVFKVGEYFYYAKTGGGLIRNQRIWASVTNDLVPFAMYDFDENGKMDIKNGFVEENGELYYYESGVKWTQRGIFQVGDDFYYAKTGGALIRNQRQKAIVTNDLIPSDVYDFDADGKLVRKNGFFEEDGELYYFENGIRWIRRGVFQVGENFYYAKANGGLIRSQSIWANVTNDLVPFDMYEFDANGKMIIKDGFVEEDGELYYYEQGVKWTRRGVFQVGENLYYAKTGGGLIRNQRIWASVTNDLVPFAMYDFDENGKMDIKNGFVEENGELYYYVRGVKWTQRGIFQVGDDFYYAKTGGALIRNQRQKAIVTNDLIPSDVYDFDADGKLVRKNGFFEEDGELYYFENGIRWTRRGVFQVGENFYYAKANGGLIRSQSIWASITNDLVPFAMYDFDENGVMVR